MRLLLDSFWRALLDCLHPRVVLLSAAPLVLMVALWVGLGNLFWQSAVDGLRAALDTSIVLNTLWGWFESIGLGALKTMVAPLIVIFAATPVIVATSMLTVAFLMTPAIVSLVARRRFPDLQRLHGASWLVEMLWSLGSAAMAALALLVSLPLWLIPPLILVLPPLIWGWLTYRVMAFDALAAHASSPERRAVFLRHRVPLLVMGLFTGYMSAAPSLFWGAGPLFAVAFVPLVPLAIWAYTFFFVLSSLWFTHFCLAALAALREQVRRSPDSATQVAISL